MGRIVLHEFCADYTPDEGQIDLRRLQMAVSELMEQGAYAIQLDGHDLDRARMIRLPQQLDIARAGYARERRVRDDHISLGDVGNTSPTGLGSELKARQEGKSG